MAVRQQKGDVWVLGSVSQHTGEVTGGADGCSQGERQRLRPPGLVGPVFLLSKGS